MRALLLFAGLVFLLDVSAAEDFSSSFPNTPEETQMCTSRISVRGIPNDQNWSHMHHYCDCLRFYDRAVRARSQGDEYTVKYDINISIGGCNYVLEHASADFNMRPEVLVMRGRSQELVGKAVEAAGSYSEALRLNPNFSMAYAALGNFYAKGGDKKEAIRLYEEGLRRHPKNRYLRARFQALGGAEPKSK